MPTPIKRTRLYEVVYHIRSGHGRGGVVGDGRLLVRATKLATAREAAVKWVEDKDWRYDDRIDPVLRIDSVARYSGAEMTESVLELGSL